jgi:hypothetical protein
MSSVPPDPRTWPSFGDSTQRITEKELREDVEVHDRQEEMRAARAPWWRWLFRSHGEERR